MQLCLQALRYVGMDTYIEPEEVEYRSSQFDPFRVVLRPLILIRWRCHRLLNLSATRTLGTANRFARLSRPLKPHSFSLYPRLISMPEKHNLLAGFLGGGPG